MLDTKALLKGTIKNLKLEDATSEEIQSFIDLLAKKKEAVYKVEEEKRIAKEKEEKEIQALTDMEIPIDFENAFSNDSESDIVCENSADGLIHSLNNLGRVDIEYISKISNKTMQEVINDLKGYIFLDPAKWDGDKLFYKGWVTKEEYLSGNLVNKYRLACDMNDKFNGFFKDNIKAIETILPLRLDKNEIYVTPGSPWIPTDVIKAFIKEVFKINRYAWCDVIHDDLTGSWSIKTNYRYTPGDATFGTKRINALTLLEDTLNLKQIAIYDEKYERGSDKKKRVLNEKETLFALEKQKLLIKIFQSWVWQDSQRANALEDIYYYKYGCYRKRIFDGGFLTFPTMNKDVQLYDYQKNAVARIIFCKNVLLAHDVGAGKTLEMIAAGQELKRIKLAKKIMYVVPNGILHQWEKMFLQMYPTAKLLVINKSNFMPKKRLDTMKEIRDGDYDGILITYSSFDMIKLSNDFYIKKMQKYENDLRNAQKTNTVSYKLGSLPKMKERLYDKLTKERENEEETIYFDELGIDRLFVDEAHNFKNVPISTKMKTVLGLNIVGSDKCELMMDKVHFVQDNGGGVIFATGTPITNSVSDIYIMQKYLQNDELNVLQISNFDAWVNMFAETSSELEIDVTTTKYRTAKRLAKFHNIPELAATLNNIADFYRVKNDKELPTFNGYVDTVIPHNDEFDEFLDDISVRADEIRNKCPRTINGVTDNMLMVTGDGRRGALDLRLINDQTYSFDKESKVYRCAKNVYDIYKKYEDKKASQLIFCDVSIPKDSFNIYDELDRILVDLGVKKEEIAYIHDAVTDKKRDELFKKVNKGEIRILIGSTFKLGTGVNVQERLIAIHHIDVPWRPSDITQREGRIIRAGNKNKEIFIYRYILQNSFDAYSWQLLEIKQNFISKLLNDDIFVRNSDDIDDMVLNYAEVKALAIGNPLIKERVETLNNIQRLKSLQKKSIEREQSLKEDIILWRRRINHLEEDIDNALDDKKYYESLVFPKEKREERKAKGQEIFNGVQECFLKRKEEKISEYHGFDIYGPAYYEKDKAFIYLRRIGKYKIEIGNSEIGILLRIDNFLNKLKDFIDNMKQEIREKGQMIISARLGGQETYEQEIEENEAKLKEINRKLGIKNEK